MTNDAEFPRQSVRPTENGGLDPALKRQIETSLHGAYAFNAATAKYGVVWVWGSKLAAIGFGLFAAYKALISIALLANRADINLVKIGPHRSDYLIQGALYEWAPNLIIGTISAACCIFMSLIASAMHRSHKTSLTMAAQYKEVETPRS